MKPDDTVPMVDRSSESLRGGQIVIRIRQATEQGYIECDPQGVCDLAYPSSQLRRARVKDRGRVCGTLMSDNQQFCVFVEYDI